MSFDTDIRASNALLNVKYTVHNSMDKTVLDDKRVNYMCTYTETTAIISVKKTLLKLLKHM